MRIAFYTLGCKVNQYETEQLRQMFVQQGFEVVDCREQADIYVINSCTVTAAGDKKTRQMLQRFHRQNPQALIALTGCMPQAFPQKAAEMVQAQVVTGSADRCKLVAQIQHAVATGERVVEITPHQKEQSFEQAQITRFADKTRAFVKIEDGCDRRCTYCIIPKARGSVRSKTLEALRTELQALATNGYREIVLSGINLSSYGKDIGLSLIDAVELSCSIAGIRRVRLGSLEPDLLPDQDIQRLSRLQSFCPQLHLSLQSGCDATLKRMGRHYDTAFYFTLVQRLREVFPGCAITTDIMVGFPGESEQEFAQTIQFVERIGFSQAHVFAYSPRAGTPAATLSDQLAGDVKKQRSTQLQQVIRHSRLSYFRSFAGKAVEVLFESQIQDGKWQGHTREFVPVQVEALDNLTGRIATVLIKQIGRQSGIGVLLE